ncbi:MAG: DUF1295 domain-containing protein [Clostridia bacterium]|nr:DUF1295 domain-containing protein [Clostridia bacterium]
MKKLKENKVFSFIVIAVVYALAGIAGYFTFQLLNALDLWLKLLIADVVATVVTFIFSVIFSNASVYDPYWSVQPIFIVIALAIGKELRVASILPIIAICIWGVCLTANWAYTFGDLTHQDWRYTMLKEKTGIFYPIINFVGIHLVPTLVVYGCVLPAVYTIELSLTANVGSYIFFALSILAVLLQGASDIQMHKFRKNRTTPFIRTGLWKYSRHPNYLGEITMWWGIGLAFVCACLSMWYLIAGAVANTLLFTFVSIPMAEKRQGKKQGFSEYKAQTRFLLPIKK